MICNPDPTWNPSLAHLSTQHSEKPVANSYYGIIAMCVLLGPLPNRSLILVNWKLSALRGAKGGQGSVLKAEFHSKPRKFDHGFNADFLQDLTPVKADCANADA